MKRFIHISVYGLLACVILAALSCGAESDGAAEPTAPLAQPAPTVEPPTPIPPTATHTPVPPTATPAPEPTRRPVTDDVGTDVGDLAPEYVLTLPQNRQISSTELVAQGKPVFILFHATW